MRVHVHTKFCFLCVLTFLFHQCNHCHGEGHHPHNEHHHADHKNAHSDLQISEAPYMRGATLSPESKSPEGDALEEEQRFYIQQLFRRYGQKDRLDFQGFQSLLFSLGLGEVKVVDVEHEDLGHDHVAHLDLLDVQEGLHSHSSTNEDQGEGHSHGRGHKHHKASSRAGHNHDHTKMEDSGRKHADGHVQDTHGHDHTHDKDEHKREQVQVQAIHKDLSSQPHSDHGHSDHDHSDHEHDHSDHDHSDHGHSDHDHSDHDHSDHGHSDHDHSDHEHDHSDHDHSDHGHSDHDHDHSDHDHSDHGHSDHDHSDHDHSDHGHSDHDHDHSDHDHSDHGHSDHDHSDHDHSDHGHSDHDHSDHDHSDHDHSDHDHDHSDHDHSDHDHSDHDHSDHDHSDHDHSDHDHSDHDHSDHDHSDHDHSDHDHSNHNHSDHDHSDHDHSNHNHSDHENDRVNQTQTSTDVPPINQQQPPSAQLEPSQVPQETQSSPAPTESRTKRTRNPGGGKRQRGRNKTNGHGNGQSHSHKDKREAPVEPVTPTPPALYLSGHSGGLSHQHEECLNLTQLLNYYGLSPESLISPSQFTYLCPALLYQIDTRVCIRHQRNVEQEALEPVNSAWVWIWGFVSITIISLLSLLGVVLVPILKQSCFKFLLTFLVALAVGTLSGDALLHLLPHSQGQHDHSQVGTSHDGDLLTAFDGVWKGLTALVGIYFLFIIEHCIGMFKHYKDQRGMKKVSEEGKIGRKLSDHKLNRRSDAEWLHLKPLSEDPDSTAISCDNGHNDTQLSELQTRDSPTNKTPLTSANPQHDHPSPTKENGRKVKQHGHGHGHGHSHGGNCHSDQEMKDAGIASIAWMVIMGDGMHNFSDGLAIGAAFSANLTGGISTSVAVFCHELPHELGDFAVLLKAGMSVKQAIVYNLLSALMAYVGMLIGTAVGQYTHNVTNWIFAITAGMFLYVALVDMLPEMLHGDSEEHKRCQLGHFILQNLGMLTGFGIMLLIAIFEDRIVFDFGF